MHSFDGFVSCLRTRTYDEVLQLVNDVHMDNGVSIAKATPGTPIRMHNWEFSHVRGMHTWPLGYMEITFGQRLEDGIMA